MKKYLWRNNKNKHLFSYHLPESCFKDAAGTPWNKPLLAISSAQSSNSAFLDKNIKCTFRDHNTVPTHFPFKNLRKKRVV